MTSGPASVVALDLQERQAALGMEPADRAERPEPRVPARQPRRGHSRQHGLCRDARRLSRRARCADRRRALDRARSATTRVATPSLRRRSSSTARSSSASAAAKRAFAATSTRTMRRPASRSWRIQRCRRLASPEATRGRGDSWVHGGGATWLTGSYDPDAQAALLGHRQSGARLERRLAQRRQPLHLVAPRDRRRDRQDALAFPVHAARRARLGREPDSGARRRRDRRDDRARSS